MRLRLIVASQEQPAAFGRLSSLLGMVALALTLSGTAAWSATYPPAPPAGSFVTDQAGLITPYDIGEINSLAAKLQRDRRAPLHVVTIRSLAHHGAPGLSVERYARGLFDNWGIGSQDHNYGILLLVAYEDRQIRVELGADWARSGDAQARDVVFEIIKPQFKRGMFSQGILEGARGLDDMARGRELSREATKPGYGQLAIPAFVMLAILICAIVSIRSSKKSRGGWQIGVGDGRVGLKSRNDNNGGSGRGSGGGGGSSGSW